MAAYFLTAQAHILFSPDGPSFADLIRQALSSTERGYDLLAPRFDATPFRTPDAVIGPAVAALGTVDSAVDLCCGTGAAMRLLRPVCRERLVGIDFSAGMLAEARERLPAAPGMTPVELVQADVLSMEYQYAFDAATCFGALGHILPSDAPRFFEGIYRSLKPGGRFVTLSAPHPPLLSRVSMLLRAFNAVMRVRNRLIKPPFIMYYLTFLLPDLQHDLEQAGFRVEVRTNVFPDPFDKYQLVIGIKPA